MCGIVGFTGQRNDRLLRVMAETIRHRGPDGDGFFVSKDGLISLGHRRLSIIDLAGGDQPIFNEDKSIAIVFNGEIYNFPELKAELGNKGHRFATKTDTEVIVHGYEEWGNRVLQKLNGMFAFAIWDDNKKLLFLARDRFGIKPLYYTFDGTKLVFASEIKALLCDRNIHLEPNEEQIYKYLAYRVHDIGKETFFKNIFRLEQAHFAIFEKGHLRIEKYWQVEPNETIKDEGDPQEKIYRFKKEFIDSVERHLISDVPVGTCLSGGLDSSSVVSVINHLIRQKGEIASVGDQQKTFSALFPGEVNDETEFIDVVVNQFKPDAHYTQPKTSDFWAELSKFVYHQDEPVISTGPFAQWEVMKLVTKSVKVVLDGQGGDELLAGYTPYFIIYLRDLWKRKAYATLIKEFVKSIDLVWPFAWNAFKEKFVAKLNPKNLLSPALVKKYRDLSFSHGASDTLAGRLQRDLTETCLPAILRYEDRNSMAFSVEARVPFLDTKLVEYILSIPESWRIRNGWNRWILRQGLKNIVPAKILKRRWKVGFTVPEVDWMRREAKHFRQVFESESFKSRPYFDAPKVIAAFDEFVKGKYQDSMVFWRMLNVEIWLRIFFDKSSNSAIFENTNIMKSGGNVDGQNKMEKLFPPNPKKNLAIELEEGAFYRFPVKTHVIIPGEDIISVVKKYCVPHMSPGDMLVLGEKAISVAQGRAYNIDEIKPSIWAKFFVKFVTKTPIGIGISSPWTMELAVREVGVPRMFFAAACSAITKPFGIKGLFYRVAGHGINQIDGPADYVIPPYNRYASLGPTDPQGLAQKIEDAVGYPATILDANDFGQEVLGCSKNFDPKFAKIIFKDNPLGQTNECTPMAIVRRVK